MKTKVNLILVVCALSSAGFFSSCNNIRELAAFDVIYTLPTTTYVYTPAGLKGDGEELLYSGAIGANLDSILNANGFDAGVVGNTQFIECTVSIVQPSGLTFGWLHSARGEISGNQDFNPSNEVGWVVNDDPEATTVVLVLNSVNIRPFLGARFFYFRVFGVLNGPVPAGWVEMAINGKLRMHLEPLN